VFQVLGILAKALAADLRRLLYVGSKVIGVLLLAKAVVEAYFAWHQEGIMDIGIPTWLSAGASVLGGVVLYCLPDVVRDATTKGERTQDRAKSG
jgi:hypothetical protein